MAPTPAQIDTWESDCRNYNTTLAAWKKVETDDVAAFNAELTKNSLKPLTVSATKLMPASCTFEAAAPATRR